MAERALEERLDDAIEAMVAGRGAEVPAHDRDLAALVRIAADLLGLPTETFRDVLEAELTGPARPSLPAGFHTVTPYLQVQRAADLVGFVERAFGATDVFRTTGSAGGLHASATIGDSKLMIGGFEGMTQETPTSLHLYVEDADAVYRRALAEGASSLAEPVDQPYGDREAAIEDLAGNHWYIATHKAGPRHVPEGLRSVTPYLHPIGAARLITFLEQAFGADEVARYESPDGTIQHAKVRIGDSIVEMGEAHGPWQPMPPAIYLYVDDVDATYARAVEAGALSEQPPSDRHWGDRVADVKDPFGNVWYIATHKK